MKSKIIQLRLSEEQWSFIEKIRNKDKEITISQIIRAMINKFMNKK
jgi:hypothetical protein